MKTQKIETGTPANRLIIGDVGSGKTLVALMSLLAFLESYHSQKLEKPITVALMAPTEVLASQHYQKLLELSKTLELDWLDSLFISNKQKLLNNQKLTTKKVEEYLHSPKLSFWVGTHALLFLKGFEPAMVITDEQHRFGVRQRQNLSNTTTKENNQNLLAHYISMTATPIPRTLALTVYGDLKASYVKKIETRIPIKTAIVELENFENRVLPTIKAKLEIGQKMFVICPSIEADEDNPAQKDELWTLKSAKEMLEKYFDSSIISSLHGKLSTKNQILEDFKNSDTQQILISTTVIEVGVDVHEASIMLIFNPERFGLAQLHQIRGRVGRNDYPDNFCFLLADTKNILFLPRLKFLCSSNDGFTIAQEDLRLRGQGDIYGTTQSGQAEDLTGLDLKQYSKIRHIVDQIDFEKVQTEYPKLEKYLIAASNEVWGE
jgi:ATP-dependent DNA helicase RecG